MRSDDTSTLKTAEKEAYKVVVAAFIILTGQLLLSQYSGLSGVTTGVTLYLLTTIVSNIVHYDPNTGLRIEWENENDASIIYWIRLGVNIVLMIAALILWSFLTLSLRNEITMSELQQPEEILEKMTRNNFPLKLAFAWLSHITLFAFWRFWINLVNGMYAAYNHNGNDRK